jgi:DNA-binding response OmpR family regulator
MIGENLMRVLLVDDEEELVSTLAERLSLRGIDATWVTNCDAALRAVGTHEYDVGLLDVKLPRMSGIELKRKLQKKQPKMKFLFITGHGSEQDYRIGAAEAGAEYYLPKPIDIELLIQKMASLIEETEDS